MTSAIAENQQPENGAKQLHQPRCICQYGSKAAAALAKVSSGVQTRTRNGLKAAKDTGLGVVSTSLGALGKGSDFASKNLLRESERVNQLRRKTTQ